MEEAVYIVSLVSFLPGRKSSVRLCDDDKRYRGRGCDWCDVTVENMRLILALGILGLTSQSFTALPT